MLNEIVISILGLYAIYLGWNNIKQDKYNDANILAHGAAHTVFVSMNNDIKKLHERINTMPSKSKSQAKLMAAAAHTPGGYDNVPQKVGKEFNQADKGTGILKSKKKTKPKSKKR